MNPQDLNKYLYIEKSPTWLIRLVNGLGILTWGLVIYGYVGAIVYDPIFRWLVTPILLIFTLYYLLSFGMNLFFYKQHSIKKHEQLVKNFWEDAPVPSVDVFLPICGESMEVLDHTWKNVSKLKYTNIKVHVLDDSRHECDKHKALAESYGFNYFSRPDKGYMKKAGNLRYAFERTNGDFITIFDADFAPHPDFLIELLPYMGDQKNAIIQSPQFFNMSKDIHKRSPLEYGGAYVQEAFYRYIQVARDHFGGSICCGSNAIYRRKALDSIGGPVMIEHSEDAITGFTLTDAGWRVKYVPLILAVGICPDDIHAYFHQQHRWCTGSMTLLLSKKFWQSEKVTWKIRMCYFLGFLYYVSNPLAVLFSFQLFYSLFFYTQYISISNGLLFYPYLLYTIILMLFFPIYRFRWGVFLTRFVQMYSYSHAVFSTFLKSTVGWIPTNSKHVGVSLAFRQATIAICIYIGLYFGLVALAVKHNLIQMFNYNFYSLQFWIFYNMFFSFLLLRHMYNTMKKVEATKHEVEVSQGNKLVILWELKTAGVFTLFLLVIFFGILII